MAIENFTTYTEADPGDDITVIASKVTATTMVDGLDAWLYDDKDAGHFDGDFEHLLTVYLDACTDGTYPFVWMLSNIVDTPYDIYAASGDFLSIYFGKTAGGTPVLALRECIAGALTDHTYTPSLGTPYYLKVKRDESVGTYGTLYCYIYSDASRETLLATLEVALHEKEDFRYIFALSAHGSGAGNSTIYTENLDLQEVVLHEKEISEGVAIGEVLIKSPGKLVSEGVALSEVLVKSITKSPFVEGIAVGEVVERLHTHIRTLTDGIAIGEVLVKQMPKVFSDGIAIGEEMFKMWVHPAIRSLLAIRVKDAVRQLLKSREL